jgi:hypothetical protein
VEALDGWLDVTEADSANKPFTLARGDGVGALQFSIASFRGGKVPDPNPTGLLSMLRDYLESSQLGEPTDIATESEPVRLAAGSVRDDEWFMRIWYVSDARNFAFVTYTVEWRNRQIELAECERIVRSIEFAPAS